MPDFHLSPIDSRAAEAMSALVHDVVAGTPHYATHPRTPVFLADWYEPQPCADRLDADTAFGAFAGDILIGTVLINGDGYISGLYVDLLWQGRGVGSALLERAVQAGGWNMSVDPHGEAMLALAARHGFEFDCIDPDKIHFLDRDYRFLVRPAG